MTADAAAPQRSSSSSNARRASWASASRALVRPGTVVRERQRQLDHRGRPRRVARRRELQAALPRLDGRVEIVVLRREVADVRQQLDAKRERRRLRRRQCGLDERTPLRDAPGGAEVPPETCPEAGGDERVLRVAGVGEGGPQVVALQLDPLHPFPPFRPAQPRPRGLGQRREVLRVRLPHGRELAAVGETVERRTRGRCRACRSAQHPSRTRPRRSTCRPALRRDARRSPR